MQENYFTKETLKAALEAKGITNDAQAQPVIDAMIKKGAIIQGINEPEQGGISRGASTYADKLKEQAIWGVQNAQKAFGMGVDTMQQAQQMPADTLAKKTKAVATGAMGAGQIGVGAMSGVIQTAFSPLTALVQTGVQGLSELDQATGGKIRNQLVTLAQEHPDLVKKYSDMVVENPKMAQFVSDSINVLTAGLGGKPIAEATSNLASKAIPVIKGGVDGGGGAILTGAQAVGDVIKSGANAVTDNSIVSGVSTVAKSALESAKRIPDRMATNVADKQATELAIKSLPTKTAQTAVRDGVDIADVKDISSIPRTPEVNKVIQTVKDYASGNKKVDPMEVIGEQTVKRFKELVKQKKEIGAKLGEASKTIGVLTKPELQNGVIAKLKQVPGLEEISLTPNGKLNFKGTTLEGNISSTVADKKALQEAYDVATKWGDGEKAHRFRQTLFENLGGKKKGLENITDTQERGFEAIRSGLSDVIETKSPSYKKYSNEYRKIVNPIQALQKRLKTLDPNIEDLTDANLGAGILARRITSTAASNADVRALLKELDSVGTTKGSSFKNTLDMQNMYNILNKYYDIAPKTGFQNLVKEGVGSSDSMVGMAKETLKNVAGQSNAVRQKALEKLLNELGVSLK